MATRIVRTADSKDVLAYLESFPNDRQRYIIDPNDSRRVIVANQAIVNSSGLKLDSSGVVTLINNTNKIVCKALKKSFWSNGLVLLEGEGIHKYENARVEINGCEITLTPNIITIISNTPRDGTQTHNPTRISPDGTQTPPPTRIGDGTQHHPPVRNSPSQADFFQYPAPIQPLTEYWLIKAQQNNQDNHDKKVKPIVAIMDTGIDFGYDWTMRRQPDPDCPLWFNEFGANNTDRTDYRPLQKDLIGWNFVGTGDLLPPNQHNNPFDDDIATKHGTRIAAIIAKQTNWDVRLMILKTHDFRGVGTLFDIFDAFEYVISIRTNLQKTPIIINASWGYYGSEVAEFTDYIRKLKDIDIWLVNAAGNSSDFQDNFRVHKLETGSSSKTERYPACYGYTSNPQPSPDKERFQNVVTVTTASMTLFAKPVFEVAENYSPTYVRIAVGAGKDGSFPEPLVSNGAVIKGSSYATAYFVAKLAQLNDAAFEISPRNFANNESLSSFLTSSAESFILTDIDIFKELQ